MARKPNIDPNIYQVDLVAGLFGAFMMVWISGAQDSDYPGDAAPPPTFATLKMSISVPSIGAYGGTSPAVDFAVADQSCYTSDVLNRLSIKDEDALPCPATKPIQYGYDADLASPQFLTAIGCVSPADTQGSHQARYSYAVQYVLKMPDGWTARGYKLSKGPALGKLPALETGWDPQTQTYDFASRMDSDLQITGKTLANDSQKVACDLQSQSWYETSIYLVPDQLEIQRANKIEIDVEARPHALRLFSDDGVATPLKSYDVDQWANIDINWSTTALHAELCTYRDGNSKCFTGSVTLTTPTPTLVLK